MHNAILINNNIMEWDLIWAFLIKPHSKKLSQCLLRVDVARLSFSCHLKETRIVSPLWVTISQTSDYRDLTNIKNQVKCQEL